MILAIDFDGVIHKAHPVPGRRMGPPVEGARDAMRKLRADGHRLIVHGVWADTPRNQKVIRDFLDYYEIPFDEITNLKPQADVYLDDRAVRFTTWADFMANTLSRPDAPAAVAAQEKLAVPQPQPQRSRLCSQCLVYLADTGGLCPGCIAYEEHQS